MIAYKLFQNPHFAKEIKHIATANLNHDTPCKVTNTMLCI